MKLKIEDYTPEQQEIIKEYIKIFSYMKHLESSLLSIKVELDNTILKLDKLRELDSNLYNELAEGSAEFEQIITDAKIEE